MLNFQAVHENKLNFAELIAGITKSNLRDLTNKMIDGILDLIAECVDTDITFEPVDPEANDPYAKTPEELHLPWNLGHVIVHITASAEEAAAIAAELARGVEYHGRSRYEVAWVKMRTIDGCRQRLEESRRIRLASLDMWPEDPHLDLEYEAWEGGPMVNAIGRFVLGLMHEDSHLGQIKGIIKQSWTMRGEERLV